MIQYKTHAWLHFGPLGDYQCILALLAKCKVRRVCRISLLDNRHVALLKLALQSQCRFQPLGPQRQPAKAYFTPHVMTVKPPLGRPNHAVAPKMRSYPW
jgi:hypothetical protein